MGQYKKTKWLLGTSGVILTAALLTQFETVPQDKTENTATNTTASTVNETTADEQQQMSEREKELVQLDWTNFEVQEVPQAPSENFTAPPTQVPDQAPRPADRTSQRS